MAKIELIEGMSDADTADTADTADGAAGAPGAAGAAGALRWADLEAHGVAPGVAWVLAQRWGPEVPPEAARGPDALVGWAVARLPWGSEWAGQCGLMRRWVLRAVKAAEVETARGSVDRLLVARWRGLMVAQPSRTEAASVERALEWHVTRRVNGTGGREGDAGGTKGLSGRTEGDLRRFGEVSGRELGWLMGLWHSAVACRAASFAPCSQLETIRADQTRLAVKATFAYSGLPQPADRVVAETLAQLARWATCWPGGWSRRHLEAMLPVTPR